MSIVSRNGLSLIVASLGFIVLLNMASAAEEASSTTVAPIKEFFDCQNATVLTVHPQLLLGQWFEVARSTPADDAHSNHNKAQCVAMNLANETNALVVNVTYSLKPEKLSENQTVNYKLEVKALSNSTDGIFNVTDNGLIKTYKIVQTDYENFVFVCGYTVAKETPKPTTTTAAPTESVTTTTVATTTTTVAPAANASSATAPDSSFRAEEPKLEANTEAFILVRLRASNETVLKGLMTQAADANVDFKKLTKVIQSDKCENGAASLVPMLTMLMAAVLFITKL